MGVLLSLNIKKAGKPSTNNASRPISNEKPLATLSLNIDSLESKDLNVFSKEQVRPLLELKDKSQKISNYETYLKMANFWMKLSKSDVSGVKNFWVGHYLYEATKLKPNLQQWLLAGNTLNESMGNTLDSSEQKLIFEEALESFTEALKIDSANEDALTGLGVNYVAGSNNPMKGIGLLLQVVGKDPKSIKANFSLGLFSMKSGQYQKAINRFETVVSEAPGGEAYFYLAQAYQNLHKNQEAIENYLKSKQYLKDPQTLRSIDHLIKELTN